MPCAQPVTKRLTSALNNESADLSLKSVRRMFEQTAIALESGEHLDSFNR